MKRATEARTTESNTPQSDRQAMVWHTVTFDDGSKEEVYATDPMDAINKANARHHDEEQERQMQRINDLRPPLTPPQPW